MLFERSYKKKMTNANPMNLEKINKEWITVQDMSEAIGMPQWFCGFCMELSHVIWTMKKKKINGINYYG